MKIRSNTSYNKPVEYKVGDYVRLRSIVDISKDPLVNVTNFKVNVKLSDDVANEYYICRTKKYDGDYQFSIFKIEDIVSYIDGKTNAKANAPLYKIHKIDSDVTLFVPDFLLSQKLNSKYMPV